MKSPVDGRSVRRARLSPKSVAASEGAISVSRSTRSDTVARSATSVKRPSTTSSTDGIAKNALYARADAIIGRLSSSASLPPA